MACLLGRLSSAASRWEKTPNGILSLPVQYFTCLSTQRYRSKASTLFCSGLHQCQAGYTGGIKEMRQSQTEQYAEKFSQMDERLRFSALPRPVVHTETSLASLEAASTGICNRKGLDHAPAKQNLLTQQQCRAVRRIISDHYFSPWACPY